MNDDDWVVSILRLVFYRSIKKESAVKKNDDMKESSLLTVGLVWCLR
jgi:hypothetical protein